MKGRRTRCPCSKGHRICECSDRNTITQTLYGLPHIHSRRWFRFFHVDFDFNDDLPRDHYLAHISPIRIMAWPHPKLLRVNQNDVQRFIGARERADENAPVVHCYPQELAQQCLHMVRGRFGDWLGIILWGVRGGRRGIDGRQRPSQRWWRCRRSHGLRTSVCAGPAV